MLLSCGVGVGAGRLAGATTLVLPLIHLTRVHRHCSVCVAGAGDLCRSPPRCQLRCALSLTCRGVQSPLDWFVSQVSHTLRQYRRCRGHPQAACHSLSSTPPSTLGLRNLVALYTSQVNVSLPVGLRNLVALYTSQVNVSLPVGLRNIVALYTSQVNVSLPVGLRNLVALYTSQVNVSLSVSQMIMPALLESASSVVASSTRLLPSDSMPPPSFSLHASLDGQRRHQ